MKKLIHKIRQMVKKNKLFFTLNILALTLFVCGMISKATAEALRESEDDGHLVLTHNIQTNNYLGVAYVVTDKRTRHRSYTETFRGGNQRIVATPRVPHPWAFLQVRTAIIDGERYNFEPGECEAWISPYYRTAVKAHISYTEEKSIRCVAESVYY